MREAKIKFLTDTVIALSHLGSCRRAQVGALIVRNGRIVCTGYNGSPPGELHCTDVGCEMQDGHCIRTTHAEANAICFAAREGLSTKDADMWVYGWDGGICHRCRKLALSAGIREIIVVKQDGTKEIIEKDGTRILVKINGIMEKING